MGFAGGADIDLHACDPICRLATACGDAHMRVDVCAIRRRRFAGRPGAVDFAGTAIVGAWLHGVGSGEVMQTINAVRGTAEHHEDRAGAVFPL